MDELNFFTWHGKVRRGTYALVGCLGLAIKHNLDRLIAMQFREKWSIFSYWAPVERFTGTRPLTTTDRAFLLTLFIVALPFIWVGLTMTVKRLRDAGQPTWLAVMFFAPVINLIFLAILAVYPSAEAYRLQSGADTSRVSPFWPRSRWGSAALAVGAATVIGVLGTWVAIVGLGQYGLSLFLALPFVMGYVSVWTHTRVHPCSYGDVLGLVTLSVVLAGAGILAIAIEGIICIGMAMPIAWVLAWLGGSLAHAIHARPGLGSAHTATFGVVLLAVPLLMGAEHALPPPVPRFQVKTSIEIAAPPEVVWRHIIAFSPMTKPNDLFFRLGGVAYPIEARIKGEGLTADRECQFSTGTFKEPILVWEPSKHFAFGVSDEPMLMTETSPYGQIHVRHLEDRDFQAERADFVLTRLPNGETRLEGTTTYLNKMWPGAYWRLYTDAFVHSIHRRVFEHVKALSENDMRSQAVAARVSERMR